jgi:hypothetical protein
LYAREYQLSALVGRGACLLRVAHADQALGCFRDALAIYPQHPQSLVGVAVAQHATGLHAEAGDTLRQAHGVLDALEKTRPIETALVRTQALAVDGKAAGAGALLCAALLDAPPGFAAWTAPIEPFLQMADSTTFAVASDQLLTRAR